MAAQPRRQIEQRLGAINDAREQGTITPEVADALELEALRKLREIYFSARGRELRIPSSTLHEIAEAQGMSPVNVSKPDRVHPSDYKPDF